MTLPSGKYMYDDVQYFAPGPSFPWAFSQAATQRARMQAMGLEPGGVGPVVVPVPPGAVPPVQNRMGRPGNVDSPLSDSPPVPDAGAVAPVAPGPGAVPPPDVPPANEPGPGAVPPPAGAMPAPVPPPQ
jgi:hypothetical protein